jgi:Zinc finger, C3HC4 type (RING finger)
LRNLEGEQKDKEAREQECLICKSFFQKGVVTDCGHLYCHPCSKAWFSIHRKCPICNQHVDQSQLTAIDLRTPNEIAEVDGGEFSGLVNDLRQIKIKGSFGSKVYQLMLDRHDHLPHYLSAQSRP